jgi:hypothetical protein
MLSAISDHRTAQSNVRSQGERRTCVGFAIASSQEWIGDVKEERSVEDILWAAHQAGDPPDREEISVENGLTGLDHHGNATELAWPYGLPSWPADRPSDASDPANHRECASWYRLSTVEFDSIALLIAAGIAIILTVKFVPLAWHNPTGLINSPARARVAGGHAVLAVGSMEHSGHDCLVVKNSWGHWWGEGGYGFMTRNYLSEYAMAGHVVGSQG